MHAEGVQSKLYYSTGTPNDFDICAKISVALLALFMPFLPVSMPPPPPPAIHLVGSTGERLEDPAGTVRPKATSKVWNGPYL